MQMMAKMNAKMTQGWKLTNGNCQFCRGVTLANEKATPFQLYCPKCDKMVNQEQSQDTHQQDEVDSDDYYETIIKSNQKNSIISHDSEEKSNQIQDAMYAPKVSNSDKVSKLIGQKLLQGWTMLAQSCDQCNVPLMKSKKGQKTCQGCGRDYTLSKSKEPTKIHPKQTHNINDTHVTQKIKVSPSPQLAEIKEQKNKQKQEIHLQKKQYISHCNWSSKVDTIIDKTLNFIDRKMTKSIEENDYDQIEKMLNLLQKIQRISK